MINNCYSHFSRGRQKSQLAAWETQATVSGPKPVPGPLDQTPPQGWCTHLCCAWTTQGIGCPPFSPSFFSCLFGSLSQGVLLSRSWTKLNRQDSLGTRCWWHQGTHSGSSLLELGQCTWCLAAMSSHPGMSGSYLCNPQEILQRQGIETQPPSQGAVCFPSRCLPSATLPPVQPVSSRFPVSPPRIHTHTPFLISSGSRSL